MPRRQTLKPFSGTSYLARAAGFQNPHNEINTVVIAASWAEACRLLNDAGERISIGSLRGYWSISANHLCRALVERGDKGVFVSRSRWPESVEEYFLLKPSAPAELNQKE